MTQIQKTILNGEITTLVETIREQFETLNSFEGRIPILEFEIIKDNVRKLYEKLYLLQRLNDPFEIIKQKELTIEEADEPSETGVESVKIDLPSSVTPVQNLDAKDKPLVTKEEVAKVDLFTSESTAFNDKLKEARDQSLGTRFRQSNPGDIKSLIAINEKFLFINELFDGDYKEYSHTIETFNTFSEKSEAFDFLDTLLKNNLWNSSSAAFLKLKETVEKRFS